MGNKNEKSCGGTGEEQLVTVSFYRKSNTSATKPDFVDFVLNKNLFMIFKGHSVLINANKD